MKLAIPEFNGRVSPVFDSSRKLLVFDVDGDKVVPASTIDWTDTAKIQREKRIRSMGVDVLVCGGISRWLADKIEEEGIILIPWISGEIHQIIGAFLSDQLSDPRLAMPGRCNELPLRGKGHNRYKKAKPNTFGRDRR